MVKVSYRGLATADFAEHVTRELEQGLARFQPIELFIDAEALRSYQSDFRKAWTNWLLQNQHCLSGMHMLFQSRVVEMGVNLVNSVVHDFVTPYADREEFEARLATALAERSSQL